MGANQSLPDYLESSIQGGTNFISFYVNEKEYIVNLEEFDPEYGPHYALVDFLRKKIGLTGTKTMCREGGCGACTVFIKSVHPKDKHEVIRSVNSCLLPLYSCDGLDITTIEKLSDSKGYHAFQKSLVNFGGTQCGFCSPGLLMNMYSYAQVNPKFTGGNVEYSLDGNICRCTGYRSIMDAFKSLSSDALEDLKRKCIDVEDCYKCPSSSTANTMGNVSDNCGKALVKLPRPKRVLQFTNRVSGSEWIKVVTLPALFDMLERLTRNQTSYRLVAGNTGIGIFKSNAPYMAYIDINDIPELHGIVTEKSGVTFGAGTSLTEAIDEFTKMAKIDGFGYASELSKHFRRIASLTIRNTATLAGNLMLKHDFPSFPSDIFVLFEAIGATVSVASSNSIRQTSGLVDFQNLDMYGKVIVSIHLPKFEANHVFRSFKIANRYQNCHAEVNAAMSFQMDKNSFKILSRPSICFGGISPSLVHVYATEEYLVSKRIDSTSLREALSILNDEVVPDENPIGPSANYRKYLSISLFYKFVLRILKDLANPRVKTGGDDVDRGLNTGVQTFDTDPSKYPLYQPIPKLDSLSLVSGKAEFVNDIPVRPDELFGVFVLSTVANAKIDSIDTSQALLNPGVVAFISAKDIPGVNNHAAFGIHQEEIFASDQVKYYGQPVGLILAEGEHAAYAAKDKVKVNYKDVKKPVVDIKESLKREKAPVHPEERNANMETSLKKDIKEVKGEYVTKGQYHFNMETQVALTIPKEDEIDVYSSTESVDGVQASIAQALHIPTNSINIFVRRIGGGFGGKSTKANHIATACAIATYKTGRPVRIVLDLETNMLMIGKRAPYLTKYKAKVDGNGKIRQLSADIYCDAGAVPNDSSELFASICFQSCYKANSWNVTPSVVLTDTAPNTYCRSPGSAQAIAAVENIMEHIARVVQKDPLEVRLKNFIRKGDPIFGIPGATLNTDNPLAGMIQDLKKSSDYEARKKFVSTFNKSNRWRKRGISIVPQRIPIHYTDFHFPTFISVNHLDGTVSVSHGGVEEGQGINTKLAQVVAYTLGVPLETVMVKATTSFISPNTAFTSASVTSELVCHSAREACLNLLQKLEPVRRQLKNPSWQELISASHASGVLLTSQYQDLTGDIISYDVWGAVVSEVEVDVLTGDYRIIRVDIIEDAGNSLNSLLDIGRIEGAFVMGLGWHLMEKLMYDPNTGELMRRNTWLYKPQLPADVPEDFRVTLVKNKPNPFGVLSSKATDEPPLNLSVSVVFSLREAIDSARADAGNFDWYEMDTPVTREDIHRLALANINDFVL